jgi:hypothetical protein
MEVTKIKKLIQVAVVPDRHEPDDAGTLKGDATFWLHTNGMAQFDRPELELRGVPALYVSAAGGILNEWAAYSVDNEIKHGQTVMGEGATIPVLMRALASQNEFWEGRNAALTLVAESVAFQCPCEHPH